MVLQSLALENHFQWASHRGKEVAEQLGMPETNVRVAIYRLRQRYAKQLRLAVQDTLAPGEDVDSEIRELMNSFA